MFLLMTLQRQPALQPVKDADQKYRLNEGDWNYVERAQNQARQKLPEENPHREYVQAQTTCPENPESP